MQDGFSLVHVAVVDTGTGLTADELATLNQGEAFTQVGLGQLQGRGGSGLGLAISKSVRAGSCRSRRAGHARARAGAPGHNPVRAHARGARSRLSSPVAQPHRT